MKRWVKPKVKKDGVVYILKIWLDGKVIYKIGATSRIVSARVLEIIGSFNGVYGYFPRVEVLKQTRIREYYKAEAELHRIYRPYKFECKEGVSGGSELFAGVDEDKLFSDYRECVDLKDRPRKRVIIEM